MLAAGAEHTIAVTESGKLLLVGRCWTQGISVSMLAAGAEHTIAVTESGKLLLVGRCWTLGLANCSDHLVPGEVAAISVRYSAHSQ